MLDRRLKIARILVTIPAVFLAIGPPIADLNATHVANPLWPGHARLHTVWLVCTNSLVSVVALTLIWGKLWEPPRTPLLVACALVASVLLGFFVAAATQSVYGGALTDHNGIPFQIASLDANLVAFGVLFLLLAIAVRAIWKPGV